MPTSWTVLVATLLDPPEIPSEAARSTADPLSEYMVVAQLRAGEGRTCTGALSASKLSPSSLPYFCCDDKAAARSQHGGM